MKKSAHKGVQSGLQDEFAKYENYIKDRRDIILLLLFCKKRKKKKFTKCKHLNNALGLLCTKTKVKMISSYLYVFIVLINVIMKLCFMWPLN